MTSGNLPGQPGPDNPATAPDPDGGTGPYLYHLALFAGTLVLSYAEHWVLRDFIWGLWLSSLTVGYSLIVYAIARSVIAPGFDIGLPFRAVGGLFMLAFFTVHFGMFHLVHGMFLNAFFPVVPDGPRGAGPLILLTIIPIVAKTSWPLILGSALSSREAFVKAGASQSPVLAYGNVVRMHILIFVFAFANITRITGWPLIAVVLLFYYFPWRHARGQARLRATRLAA